jgi:hypothetical protein
VPASTFAAMRLRAAIALLAVLPLLALAAPSGALGVRSTYVAVGAFEQEHDFSSTVATGNCPLLQATVTIHGLPGKEEEEALVVVDAAGHHLHPEAGNDPAHPLLPPAVCAFHEQFQIRGNAWVGYQGKSADVSISIGRLGAATQVRVTHIGQLHGTFDFRPFLV